MSAPVEVVVVNQSTVVQDALLEPIIFALQTQVDRDFAPAYGISARLSFVADAKTLPDDKWWLAVLDDSDQANALGYHDLTSAGLPLGKVFAKSDLAFGDAVSVTMSHELLEMLADPFINLCIIADDEGIYAYEVGDPVENDALGYLIDNVRVSDFVLPAYFEPASGTTRVRTDFVDALRGARAPALTSEGYISRYNPTNAQWTQIFGEGVTRKRRSLERAHMPLGSRRWRRSVPMGERLRSTVATHGDVA